MRSHLNIAVRHILAVTFLKKEAHERREAAKKEKAAREKAAQEEKERREKQRRSHPIILLNTTSSASTNGHP